MTPSKLSSGTATLRSIVRPVVKRARYTWQSRPQSDDVRQFRKTGAGVLITSIPKSGTHLLNQLMSIIGLNLTYKRGSKLIQYYGWPPQSDWRIQDSMESVVSVLNVLKPGYYVKGHLIPDPRILAAVEETGIRVIFIYRDPRALIWSHVNHVFRYEASKFHTFYTQKMPSREACIDLSIRGAAAYADIVDFPEYWLTDIRTTYESFMGWREHPSCLAVKFEDLIGEKGAGSSEQQRHTVEAILKHIHFPYDDTTLDHYCSKVYSESSQTFHKGQIDTWRTVFTEENIHTFNEIAGDLLARLGYEEES